MAPSRRHWVVPACIAAALVLAFFVGRWLWLPRGQELATLRGHEGLVRSVALSPDGSLLASAGDNGRVCLWDTAAHRLLYALDGHGEAVTSVAFSPRAALVASASIDRTVKLWDPATGQHLATLDAAVPASGVAFSPDGSLLAVSGSDGKVRVWRMANRELARTLTGHTKAARTVAFSPDGHLLASGAEDGTIRFWDARSGAAKGLLRLAGSRAYAAAFSPDSKTLAVAVSGAGLQWFDVATRKERPRPEGAGLAMSVAFGADQRTLVTGHEDGSLKFWNATDGKPVKSMEAHRRSILGVAIAPAGLALSAGGDGTVKLWANPVTE